MCQPLSRHSELGNPTSMEHRKYQKFPTFDSKRWVIRGTKVGERRGKCGRNVAERWERGGKRALKESYLRQNGLSRYFSHRVP
jgi:hypothetical protein